MTRLRFLGTTSDDGDCPTLYEVEGTSDIPVQGDRVTDPEQLVQLRDVKASETFVLVPRDLLVRFAPRTTATEMVPFTEIAPLFREFKHTAFRLETRRGYASDRNSPRRTDSACRKTTSGCSTPGWSPGSSSERTTRPSASS